MKDNAQVATGTSPKNPDKIKRAKKTIAQMKTILHERATHVHKEAGQASLPKSQPKKETRQTSLAKSPRQSDAEVAKKA